MGQQPKTRDSESSRAQQRQIQTPGEELGGRVRCAEIKPDRVLTRIQSSGFLIQTIESFQVELNLG